MDKSPVVKTPIQQNRFGAEAVTTPEWEKVFSYLRANKKQPHKWRIACSMLPGVGLSTLKRRFRRNDARVTQKGPECVLGADIEEAIVEFLLAQADIGNAFPVDLLPAKVREIASDLFKSDELAGFVGGRDWHERFQKRHPVLSVRLGQLSEQTRLSCLSREAVERFYSISEIALDGVDPENVWFMDESGIAARGAQIKVSPFLCKSRRQKSQYTALTSAAGVRTQGGAIGHHSKVGDHQTHHSGWLRLRARKGSSPRTHL